MSRLSGRAVVALLVVFAGCGGFGGGAEPTETAPEVEFTDAGGDGTSTGAPSATTPDRDTYPGSAFPPGANATGIDASVLASGHRDRLSRTAWTLVITRTARAPNGTRLARTRTRVVENRTGWAATVRTTGPVPSALNSRNASFAVWTNRSASATRQVLADGTVRYQVWDRRAPPALRSFDRTGGGTVALALDTVDVRYVGVVDGALAFAGDRELLERESLPTVRNLSLRLFVRPDGTVRSYTYRYEIERDDRRVVVTERVAVRNVGETTVERPSWYTDARNATRAETETEADG
ncbi:MAG: hypothetical protein ABEJ79_05520 [Halolamina sp.]